MSKVPTKAPKAIRAAPRSGPLKRKVGRTARPADIKALVGRNLQWGREVVAQSSAQCARDLNVDPGTWHLWEKGKRYPDPAAMVRFCDERGLSMDFIYRSQLAAVDRDVALRLVAFHPELVLDPESPEPAAVSPSTAEDREAAAPAAAERKSKVRAA